MSGGGIRYRDAGVDIDAGNELAEQYRQLLRSTFPPAVLANDGGFAGLYRLRGVQGLFSRSLSDPVLVSGADGVGTKLKIAFASGRHDTVGIDLVAMSVNDILVQGAEPLFFLDYVAIGTVEKRVVLDIVRGVTAGCREAGCALLGGETAEMPGLYAPGEYDLAGFAVGIVERRRIIDGSGIRPGDVVLGLPSTGLHSNGYSLARKVLLEHAGLALDAERPELGCTLAEELLRPTAIYARPLLAVFRGYRWKKPVHGIVHVTGGGLVENVPRILPQTCDAVLDRGAWPEPPVFDLIRRLGEVPEEEMQRVFNLGLGMLLIVSDAHAAAITRRLARTGTPCRRVGRIESGSGSVRFVGERRSTEAGPASEEEAPSE